MKTLCIFFTLILYASASLGQSTLIEQASPNPAAAQLFFFDRTSHNTTDRNWKIATLPASSNSSGDKLLIELFGGSHGASSTFQQIIHLGNRGGFNGYLRATYGNPYQSVRIRAFEQPDGSIDVFLSLLANGWKGASVRIYEGSGIVTARPVIYETPVDVGASPSGSPVFDSYNEIPGLVVKNDGKMGIGILNPGTKLETSGTIRITSTTPVINFKETDITDKNFQLDVSGGNFNIRTNNNVFNSASTKFSILNNGSVGIGTINTFGYKLAVNGKIGSKEVNVEVSSAWPDFVFKKDYTLPTLEEVETHIKTKGHLKDIPSEAEVKENGINLGEMDAKLLQKIEELTLYTIEQGKTLKAQEKRIETQTAQNAKQQEKIQKLEKENEALQTLSKEVLALKAIVETLRTKN